MSTKLTGNISHRLSSIFSVFLLSEPEWQSCISWWNHVYIQYNGLNSTKICRVCPLYHRPVPSYAKFHENRNSAEMGKFHGSAQNSVFRGKLWSLQISYWQIITMSIRDPCAGRHAADIQCELQWNFHTGNVGHFWQGVCPKNTEIQTRYTATIPYMTQHTQRQKCTKKLNNVVTVGHFWQGVCQKIQKSKQDLCQWDNNTGAVRYVKYVKSPFK